ncbi:hypothetical protein Mapa_000640 [Marchantia paleacea]|nr:hypothetical protein Mapa_000640 [Marchantia paleacea]
MFIPRGRGALPNAGRQSINRTEQEPCTTMRSWLSANERELSLGRQPEATVLAIRFQAETTLLSRRGTQLHKSYRQQVGRGRQACDHGGCNCVTARKSSSIHKIV